MATRKVKNLESDKEISDEVSDLFSEYDDIGNVGVALLELGNKEDDEDIKEEKEEYTPIVKKILNISTELEELDDYFNELPSLQSQTDEEISDLLHYIENNDLTPKQSRGMIKLLKEKRLIRRSLCNDYEIKKVYIAHRNKLAIDTQRSFFLNEIYKKANELGSKYRNRQLSEDRIEELIK